MMQATSDQLSRPIENIFNLPWKRSLLLLIPLIIGDLLMVALGFRGAYTIRFDVGVPWFASHEVNPIDFYQRLVFFLVPLWIIVFWLFGLYDFKNIFSGMREYSQIFNACTLGAMIIIIFTFFDPNFIIARAWLILSWLLICFNVTVWRFTFRRFVHWMRGKGRLMTRVLIVGANEEGQAIAQQLKGNAKSGIKIMGFADDRLKPNHDGPVGLPVLGSIDSVTTLIRQHDIQEVIVISSAITRKNLLTLFETLDPLAVPVRLSSGLYELITTGLEIQEFANVPLLSVNKVRLTGADMVLKRALDIVGATVGLILLLPVMVIIAIFLKLDSPGPIFYRRRVIGVGGKPFDAFKFRSMCVDADERLARDPKLRSQFQANYKLKDDPRVTRVGQFLRDKSLDELPQLINVFLGQMSLVGPRMITAPELDRYGKWGLNLGTVKPGMTGLWQVSGRSDVGYDERVRLDMHYIRNYSIWFDLYLLWLTVPAVLKKRGAY
jgi:exopolysaccharide biosynthesis polyprenyl glycosylphosphotransferase